MLSHFLPMLVPGALMVNMRKDLCVAADYEILHPMPQRIYRQIHNPLSSLIVVY